MKKTNMLWLVFLMLAPIYIFSQDTPEEIAAKFFDLYSDNTDAAFDYLFGTNPWMANNPDGIANVKFKVRQSANLMGSYIDHEMISEKIIGESFKAEIQMVKYERQPLRFVFMYYKPKDEWIVYNFSFDEKIDEDLEAYLKTTYTTTK